MTRLTRARLTLAALCALFFLLGTGSTMAVFPPVSPSDSIPNPNYDELLHLTAGQVAQRNALIREWEARHRKIDDELKKIFYPRFQQLSREIQERFRNDILNQEQRILFDEYSTGKRELPGTGEKD